jgi:hypothetical protein
MQLRLSDMLDNVIAHYHLRNIATPNGYVYCKICQGMYGLPQAGIIAQELLAKRLKEHGYTQSKTTPGLWTHEWRPITFSLVVDNFRVKYIKEEHAQHLLHMAQKILYMLVRKGGGKILRTHHQVGLCWQEGAPFDAIICQEGIKALSASSTYHTAGSTISARQKVVW